MKAVRVSSIFGYDWKLWAHKDEYEGKEHEFKYNEAEYLPLDVVLDHDYLILSCDIEEIDYED